MQVVHKLIIQIQVQKMVYNQDKHVQLLKRSKDLKNKDKYLEKDEYSELLHYNVVIEHHLFWEQRYQVYKLMQNFLNNTIDGDELASSVFGFRRNLMNSTDQFLSQLVAGEIKGFQPDSRSEIFKGFLSGLFTLCDEFMEDYENPEFYTSIQNGFLKFEKVLNEE